jgi:hypothetical protein
MRANWTSSFVSLVRLAAARQGSTGGANTRQGVPVNHRARAV